MFDIAIVNGLFMDPSQLICSKQNIYIKNGVVNNISSQVYEASNVIDATGLVVCPAFVDIHMHEGNIDDASNSLDSSIFKCMLKMGVGTVVGGNCGEGPLDPIQYLDFIDKTGVEVNVALLVSHGSLRQQANLNDKYAVADDDSLDFMESLCNDQLSKGCVGLSFGIRYIPGINKKELLQISRCLKNHNGILTAHIRDDATYVVPAVKELLDVGIELGIKVQISHIGSMAAYGQMEDFLCTVDSYRFNGLDVAMDTYPYNAFSTGIGETTYDDGFLLRYGIDYDAIEIAEGPFKGQRLTKQLFEKLRNESPKTITIGHVMNGEEVKLALTHPNVFVASDGFMHNGEGHPRAAATFPHFLRQAVIENKLMSLYDAIEKITWKPAKHFGLFQKGSLKIGNCADVTIFDPNKIKGNATFDSPTERPDGIEWVILSGKISLQQGEIVACNGKSLRQV